MSLKVEFKVQANWKKDLLTDRKNYKNHTVSITGKPDLKVSAAKEFKGNPEFYNPEDLLLSSLISCQMMSYFYVCQKHKIDLLSYSSTAEGVVEVNETGSGKFIEVVLFPKAVIQNEKQIAQAISLHHEAHQLCFIANSCNFKIIICPTCEVEQ
ncbi:OsmC family protein [Flavobacterium agrisoli]|uniref:OsmC family protein n=1 Tax=Flavobacterium agrisoli TaxID=2793066 RepID=A0A934PN66_9FLAO|nr:OsmC family protein [Flavobacterium agrisoli]MBK0369493.1 OsmC family protein [Flavobacterium agrisoli]